MPSGSALRRSVAGGVRPPATDLPTVRPDAVIGMASGVLEGVRNALQAWMAAGDGDMTIHEIVLGIQQGQLDVIRQLTRDREP